MMKDVISKMVSHPFATVIVVSSIVDGAARLIGTVKGNDVKPIIQITTTVSPKTK